jgi:hypothetical protein
MVVGMVALAPLLAAAVAALGGVLVLAGIR